MCFRENKKKKKKATAHHHLGSFVLQTAQGHCRARSGRWWPSVPAVAGELVSEGELPLACQAPRLLGHAVGEAAVSLEKSAGRYRCGGDETTGG